MIKDMPLVRYEGTLGGVDDHASRSDANELAVAMAVSQHRLPTKTELRLFAEHLGEVSDRLLEIANEMATGDPDQG